MTFEQYQAYVVFFLGFANNRLGFDDIDEYFQHSDKPHVHEHSHRLAVNNISFGSVMVTVL